MSAEKMKGVGIGRIVHFVLSQSDVEIISQRRRAADNFRNAVMEKTEPGILPDEAGLQLFNGNPVLPGQHVAMVIVAIHNDYGLVNGQVLLDGVDSYWVIIANFSEDPQPHTWHWCEPA